MGGVPWYSKKIEAGPLLGHTFLFNLARLLMISTTPMQTTFGPGFDLRVGYLKGSDDVINIFTKSS